MDLHGEARQVATGVLSFISVVYLITLLVYYWKKSQLIAANIMMIAVCVPVWYAITRTGGTTASPITPLVLIASLLSFVLGGFRTGVAWTLVAFIGFCLLFLFEESGWIQADQLLDDTAKRDFRLAIPFVTTALCVAAIIIYEFLNGRLRNELDRKRQLFAYQATHDTLTGLPNRDAFNQSAQLNLEAADIASKKLAIVLIDLDGFKPINDSYGHHAGDIVLQTVAQRLQKVIRGSDMVARLGGDEFGLLFSGYDNKSDIDHLLRKILETVSDDIIVGNICARVSASIGVSIYPDDGMIFERLCRQADLAMYRAKKHKNHYCFYHEQNGKR